MTVGNWVRGRVLVIHVWGFLGLPVCDEILERKRPACWASDSAAFGVRSGTAVSERLVIK
jgi:hypothetical protein